MGQSVKFLEPWNTNYLDKKWVVRRSEYCWKVSFGRNFHNLVARPVRRDKRTYSGNKDFKIWRKKETWIACHNYASKNLEGALTSQQALSCHHVPPRFMIMTVQWPMCSHTHDLISLLKTAISMLSNCYFPLLLHCLPSCIMASQLIW